MTPDIAEKTLAGRGVSVARKPAGPAPEILRSPHASVSPKTSEAAAASQTRGLTKIYKMGEIEVPALRLLPKTEQTAYDQGKGAHLLHFLLISRSMRAFQS